MRNSWPKSAPLTVSASDSQSGERMTHNTSTYSRLSCVRIKAIRTAVPDIKICAADESAFYTDPKKASRMDRLLGMDQRRICPPDVTASDLCVCAAEDMLKTHPEGRRADALIFVSQNPDWRQPPTACELQVRLGLPRECAAFDVNQGCAGYVYGLWIAASLAASKAADRILLLAGDAHTAGRDRANRVTAPVFGDGGSATLIERDSAASEMLFGIGTDGKGFEEIITPAGGARIPFLFDEAQNAVLVEPVMDPGGNPWRLADTWMNGGKVFDFTMRVVPAHLKAMMQFAGNPEIGALMLHQANRHIVESIATRAGFPRSMAPATAFEKYGNLAVASIPSQICESYGTSPLPENLLLCGYGIGFSWASCLLRPDGMDCAPPIEFRADPKRKTRAERIGRWLEVFRGRKEGAGAHITGSDRDGETP